MLKRARDSFLSINDTSQYEEVREWLQDILEPDDFVSIVSDINKEQLTGRILFNIPEDLLPSKLEGDLLIKSSPARRAICEALKRQKLNHNSKSATSPLAQRDPLSNVTNRLNSGTPSSPYAEKTSQSGCVENCTSAFVNSTLPPEPASTSAIAIVDDGEVTKDVPATISTETVRPPAGDKEDENSASPEGPEDMNLDAVEDAVPAPLSSSDDNAPQTSGTIAEQLNEKDTCSVSANVNATTAPNEFSNTGETTADQDADDDQTTNNATEQLVDLRDTDSLMQVEQTLEAITTAVVNYASEGVVGMEACQTDQQAAESCPASTESADEALTDEGSEQLMQEHIVTNSSSDPLSEPAPEPMQAEMAAPAAPAVTVEATAVGTELANASAPLVAPEPAGPVTRSGRVYRQPALPAYIASTQNPAAMRPDQARNVSLDIEKAKFGTHMLLRSMESVILQNLIDRCSYISNAAKYEFFRRKEIQEERMITNSNKLAKNIVMELQKSFVFGDPPADRETTQDMADLPAFLRLLPPDHIMQYILNNYQCLPAEPDPVQMLLKLWQSPLYQNFPNELKLTLGSFAVKIRRNNGYNVGTLGGWCEFRRFKDFMDVCHPATDGAQPNLAPLELEEDAWGQLLDILQLIDSAPSKGKVEVGLSKEELRITVCVNFLPDMSENFRVSWSGMKMDYESESVETFDFYTLLSMMDHLAQNAAFRAEYETVSDPFFEACDEYEELGLPEFTSIARAEESVNRELIVGDVSMAHVTKVMNLLDQKAHTLGTDQEEQCKEQLKLALRPYQLSTLAFMCDHEQADRGVATNFWVRVPTADEGLHCLYCPVTQELLFCRNEHLLRDAVAMNMNVGFLCLEVGLGKTACALALTLLRAPPEGWRTPAWEEPSTSTQPKDHINKVHGGTLVIAPKSLIGQWEMEIAKTVKPGLLKVLRWYGNTKVWNLRALADYDIVLTTAETANANDTFIKQVLWYRIFVDEYHLQKKIPSVVSNDGTMAISKWFISGTPVNSQGGRVRDSLSSFFVQGQLADGPVHQKYLAQPRLMTYVMQKLMVRYTQLGTSIDGSVNLQLPDLTEVEVQIRLSAGQQQEYDKMHETAVRMWSKNPLEGARQATNLRQTLAGGYRHPKHEVSMRDKTAWVLQALNNLKQREPNSKVLIMSEFQSALLAIQERLPDMGLNYRTITKKQSLDRRKQAVETFQNDPPTTIFLLTIKAGAVGLSLTAATHLFLVEPQTRYTVETQAIGRCWRMGQTKPVQVTRFYIKDTIEDNIRNSLLGQRARSKRSQQPGDDDESTEEEEDEEDDCDMEDYRSMLQMPWKGVVVSSRPFTHTSQEPAAQPLHNNLHAATQGASNQGYLAPQGAHHALQHSQYAHPAPHVLHHNLTHAEQINRAAQQLANEHHAVQQQQQQHMSQYSLPAQCTQMEASHFNQAQSQLNHAAQQLAQRINEARTSHEPLPGCIPLVWPPEFGASNW